MSIYTATIMLILVMDPLGNIPPFLSILNTVEPSKRNNVILRESFIAFLILTLFLFSGKSILKVLGVTESALGIGGGIILFLIAIKMIFPSDEGAGIRERQIGEPFIVPLAIPLIAGPSALATVLLFTTNNTPLEGFIALAFASAFSTIILLFANQLRRLLGQKGLVAIERLMGMILTTVAVQMFLSGIQHYFKLG